MSARQAGATSLTQQSENFGYSRVRLRRIAKMQFGIINPNELVSTLCLVYVYSCIVWVLVVAFVVSSFHSWL